MKRQVINGIEINSLEDLSKLKPFVDNKNLQIKYCKNIKRIRYRLKNHFKIY